MSPDDRRAHSCPILNAEASGSRPYLPVHDVQTHLARDSKLREAEVKLAGGTAIARVCKDPGVTEPTYHRWREEYGGMKLDQAKRLKQLEGENARLKRLLADAELDEAVLKEAAAGRY